MGDFTLREALSNGLRARFDAPMSTPYLEECNNLAPLENGLNYIYPLTQISNEAALSAAGITYSWPFPQVFKGQKHTIIAGETAVAYIDLATGAISPLTLHAIDTNALELLSNPSFNSDTVWTKGTGWAISAGSANFTGSTSEALYQELTLTEGALYKLVVDCEVTTGSLKVALGRDTIVTPEVGEPGVSMAMGRTGIYTDHLVCGSLDMISIYPSPDFRGKVNLISLRLIPTTVITPGSSWQFADAGSFWMLYNGNCTIINVPGKACYCDDSIEIATGCYFRGRIITAGFNTSKSVYQGFGSKFQDWTPTIRKYVGVADTLPALSQNWVKWTAIGGDDALWPYFPWLAWHGAAGYSTVDEFYHDWLLRNDMGERPMPSPGSALVVKPLGGGVMYYAQDGIFYLRQVSDPEPTFSLVEFPEFLTTGLAGRGAVAGTEAEHCFLDTEGNLWKIDNQLKLTKLGFKEYLSSFLGQEMMFSYNQAEHEYTLSTENLSYRLTRTGLCKLRESIISQIFTDIPMGFSLVDLADNTMTLVTHPMDIGTRAIKNLTFIELGGVSEIKPDVSVYYRLDASSLWSQTDWITPKFDGKVRIDQTGVEFKLALRYNTLDLVRLEYVNLNWEVNRKIALTSYLPITIIQPEPEEPEPVVSYLVAGTGWIEPLADLPAIGTGFGSDAKALARWDVVPYQTISGDFKIGVVAFHINNISKVSFSLNNGPWLDVTTPTLNTTTGVVEYWTTIKSTDLPDGPVEIRAIAYPITGIPRVLGKYQIDTSLTYNSTEESPWSSGEHSMLLVVNNGNVFASRTRYVATNGNDTTGDGSEAAPFLTVAKAVDSLKLAGHVDGGTVYLKAGTYSSIGLNGVGVNQSTWLTITGAPGTTKNQVIIRAFSSRTQAELLRFKSVTFSIPAGPLDRLFYGGLSGGSRYLWLDDVVITTDSRTNNSAIWRDVQGFFATNVYMENNARGFGGHLLRNVDFAHLGDDAFTDAKLLINSSVVDIDTEASNNTGAHPDVYQIYDPNLVKSNQIVYGLTAVENIGSQGVFAGTVCKEIALVNVNITQTGGSNWVFRFGDVDNLFVKDSTFLGNSAKFDIVDPLRVRNVVLENIHVMNVAPYLPPGYDQPGIVVR
jgi:hypothetical protein